MSGSRDLAPRWRAVVGPDDHGSAVATPGETATAFASPRRVLVGRGEALRIEVPAPWPEHLERVTAALAAIEGDPAAPVQPVAFGALPYDRNAAATFVVPRELRVHGVEGDRHLLRLGHPDHEGEPDLDQPAPDPTDAPTPAEPSCVQVRATRPAAQWCDAVRTARDRIRSGELTKVVLARELEVHADAPFDAATLWNRLRAQHAGALCFAVDGFVGASPELLVSRIGDTVRAQPMAGTTARTGHPEDDQRRAAALLGSAKNLVEHQITIDAVVDALLRWCSYLDSEPTPSVVAAGPVQHLATLVEGRLSHPEPSVLELVAGLHPTPAVGGSPTGAALGVQAELEGADRGRYAGPVGWVDATGNGVFAVGIRSVQLDGADARMFAGVGVVADSDPDAELEETRAKAQAMLALLLRP